MSPATVLSTRAIMGAVALPRYSGSTLCAITIATAIMLVALLVLCFPEKLSRLTTRFRIRPKSATAADPPTHIPTCNGDDSGYAGSETLSDGPSEDEDPHCDSSAEEDIEDENYDLYRAIRLCQEAATPRRTPASPYSKDFEVYTTFLSETQKRARYRNAALGGLGAQ